MTIALHTPNDIPTNWKRISAKRKSTVTMRKSNGIEAFKVAWQNSELISNPETDIILQSEGTEYPCRLDIFNETYEMVDEETSTYRKKATSNLVEIPEGVEVEIHTLEGILHDVSWPDYIVIGAKDELYANTKTFVDKNLEILV